MIINTLFGEEEIFNTKICVYCKQEKLLSDYSKHKNMKDNLDSRCKQCVKERSKSLRLIRKTAPPKPDVCECCGEDPELKLYRPFWVLDEDHENGCFRGWLCDSCNVAIGHLGDNLEGVMKAVKYFVNTLDSNEKEKIKKYIIRLVESM